jgi:cytochrome P450
MYIVHSLCFPVLIWFAPQTTSTLATFILAMVLNPQVLHKAQAELDEVVGYSRLPDEKDRPHLPYVSAIVKEVLR